jgi:uncharacterized protein (DUF433 family)
MARLDSLQRSFRLSGSTASLLDDYADRVGEPRNAVADRVLGEGLRIQRHPAIWFRTGAAGRREPALAGSRLLVRQVVRSFRAERADVQATAEGLGISAGLVTAALDYYADFTAEVDDDQAWADRIEADEHARWERVQAVSA